MKPWKPAFSSPSISRPRGAWAGWVWGLALLACAGSIPEPGESHLRWAEQHGIETTLPWLHEGMQLFVSKCDGCHSLPRLKRYAPSDWPSIMDSMWVEAKLSAREDTLIRAYVTVASGWWRDSLAALRAQ